MRTRQSLSRRLIAANEDEFGLHTLALKFPGRRRQRSATQQRQELLDALDDRLHWVAGGTKPYLDQLSPGCQRCVEGNWSCLFVNARCNASCFYCPTAQDRTEAPATNNLLFRHPAAYARYLERLGFTGASLSGGEPLLTLNRTLAFLRAARQALGPAGHLWMYTNGILLTRPIAAQLAAAGLDEIRFDIGATVYRCDAISVASGLIPVISVEIPAVPEALPILKERLPELPGLGVHYLNLHQLRLTRYNFRHLTERNYTFLHGEKITVLDSELTALEILAFVSRSGLELPVNYCSFVFKHRHQKAAGRRRAAQLAAQPREAVTRPGFIRSLALTGPREQLQKQVELWQRAGLAAELWALVEDATQLKIAPQLVPHVHWYRLRLVVSYDQVQLAAAEIAARDGDEIPLDPGPPVKVVRRPASGTLMLAPAAAKAFSRSWLDSTAPVPRSAELSLFGEWEDIPEGLQRYF